MERRSVYVDSTYRLRLFVIHLNEYLAQLRPFGYTLSDLLFSEICQLFSMQAGEDLLKWLHRHNHPFSAR